MQAVKGNKVYNISESEKARYISMGYDIKEGEEVIEYGKGKTVSFDDYMKLKKENEELKEQLNTLTGKEPEEKEPTKTKKTKE